MIKANSTETNRIMDILENKYHYAVPTLDFKNPFELLCATILSAQCTDKRVNQVTKVLFDRFPDAVSMADADTDEISEIIKPCGCYKVKAKNLIGTAKKIVDDYGGEVPRTLDDLVTLPGVGRKTANVVLSNAFGIPGLAVDTHIMRVSYRLGLSDAKKDPLRIEQDLCSIIPMEKWGRAHHWLIYFGREICSARKPSCGVCPLKELCTSEDKVVSV